MSSSLNIIGFISTDDETYKKHCAVLRACLNAGIVKLPEETAEYFNCQSPEEYLFKEKLTMELPLKEWDGEYSSGYEVAVDDLPTGLFKIRISYGG
jgi:hypothetical protein